MQQIKYSTRTNDKNRFHLIQCEIEHNGEANVSKMFEPAIVKKEGNQRFDVSFRGRPMNGKLIKLSDDHVLTNLKTSNKNEHQFLTNETTNEFHYWNYDQIPDDDDNTNQAINWLNLSKCINQTVTIDDLNKFVD